MVSLAVISILILGVYSLVILSLRLTTDNKNYVSAIEIANQKMEQIRNMPYAEVGVSGGFPSGAIPQTETIIRGSTFTVKTYIVYHDDPFDGTAGAGDTIINDYKIATIKVDWNNNYGNKNVTVFSKVIPRTEETAANVGLLKIHVLDSNGFPVNAADVRIVNTSHGIDVINPTDIDGILYYPAPESFQDYEITVTKAGYGTDYSFPLAAGLTPVHLSVTEGNKTEESFSIDKLAILNITAYEDDTPENWLINKEISSSLTKSNIKASSDSSDNLYFAWQENSLATSSVYVQKYDTSKNRQWTNDVKISNTNNQTKPAIVTSGSGQSFVVWQDNSLTLKQITLNTTQNRYAKNQTTKIFQSNTLQLPRPSNFLNFFDKLHFSEILKFKNFLKNNKNNEASAAGSVSFVSASGGATGDTLTITINKPAGTQAGDLMLAYIHHDRHTDGPIIAPTGWSTLDNNIQPSGPRDDHRGGIFYKFAGASESANYTFTMDDSKDEKAGHIRTYRGVDPASPFNGSLVEANTNYGNFLRPAPSKTVAQDGSMLVCGWGSDTSALGNNSPTFPAGMSNTRNDNADQIAALSADQSVNISNSPTGNKNLDAHNNLGRDSFNWCLVLKPEIISDNITLSTIGSQTASILKPNTNQNLGGVFVLTENNVSHTITSIKISENGTINAQTGMTNVKLFYDSDSTAPYDCASESYNPSIDLQLGTTQSFDGPDGSATFSITSGVSINTTKTLCVYVIADITSSANKDETIEIKINSPDSDIITNSGSVLPITPIEISGTTNIIIPADLQQIHYRFREDDGDEISATWNTFTDNAIDAIINSPIRLRFEISNKGSLNSSATNFEIAYGIKTTTCDAITPANWVTIPTDSSVDWQILNSANITDSSPTTNISGIIDENSNFIPGEIKDSSNQTSAITLTQNDFTEIEYSLTSTNNATDQTYCFRLTNAGNSSEFSYHLYPEASIIGDENIYIKSLKNDGTEEWTTKRVNVDNSTGHQKNPAIALTENFGNATTSIVWEDYRNNNSDIYLQIFDKNGNRQLGSDLQITSSSTHETSPVVKIDGNDKVYIVWENEGEIYLTKYNLNGTALWATHKNISRTVETEFSPKLAIDNLGNLIITWSDLQNDIYLSSYDSNGNQLWITKGNIESDEKNQSYSDIALQGTNIYLAWTDNRAFNNNIYSQLYNLSGTPQWSRDRKLNDDNGANNQNYPTVVISSSNLPFSAWTDERDGHAEIYGSQIIPPNALTPKINFPIVITGTKLIYQNPTIYKYNETHTTDASGQFSVLLEWDNAYTIAASSTLTSFNVTGCLPENCPVSISPDENKNLEVYVE